MKRVSFTCQLCGATNLKNSEKHVDHIIPVVSNSGFTDWNSFIPNLFCDEDNFQIICIPCHDLKSEKENHNRHVFKRKKKKATKKKKRT
jgi:5-methylcytosine-specific restriction endonuclease McrA